MLFPLQIISTKFFVFSFFSQKSVQTCGLYFMKPLERLILLQQFQEYFNSDFR